MGMFGNDNGPDEFTQQQIRQQEAERHLNIENVRRMRFDVLNSMKGRQYTNPSKPGTGNKGL